MMASQAAGIDGCLVAHRAGDVVVADLGCAFTGVGHVAVGAGHAIGGVDALAPGLEIGMLSLQHRRAGVGVGEVDPADLVVELDRVLDGQALRPWEGEGLVVAGEVVLDVALRADVGAHLLGGGVGIDVEVRHALAGHVLLDAVDERWAGDPQLHRLRVVAVDAGDRATGMLHGVGVGQLVHGRPARRPVAVAEFVDDLRQGCMTVQASAGLIELEHPAGVLLIDQHVLVAARLAVVDRERVALPHVDEPRVGLELRMGDEQPGVGLGGLAGDLVGLVHLGGTQIGLVLQREVLSPNSRIIGGVGDLDDLGERVLGLLLVGEDRCQQPGEPRGGDGAGDEHHDRDPLPAGSCPGVLTRCVVSWGAGIGLVCTHRFTSCVPRRRGNGCMTRFHPCGLNCW